VESAGVKSTVCQFHNAVERPSLSRDCPPPPLPLPAVSTFTFIPLSGAAPGTSKSIGFHAGVVAAPPNGIASAPRTSVGLSNPHRQARRAAIFAPRYSLRKSCGCRILATEEMTTADRAELNQPKTAWEEVEDATAGPWGQLMNETQGVPVIAVVDDDESVRESLAGLAESVGYEAALFASAEEFLQSAPNSHSLACLILDVRLPGMSGVELYTELRLRLRSIPTIFITAHADPAMSTWATKPAVIAVLYKPFQPEVLLQAVRKAIIQSRT
jgi:CheY-like chemotaxis protein